jgi:hypothetical protein
VENDKKSSVTPPSPQTNLKGKKARHLECMLGSSHWPNEILLPKEFVTIFGLG